MRKIIALALSLNMLSVAYADGLLSTTNDKPQSATPTVQTGITAQVTPAVVTEEQARELIRVSYTPIPMTSKLKKMYCAYQVTLASEYPNTLNVNSANIINGTPGIAASQTVYTSKANMWWGAILGLGGVIIIGLPILGVISSSNKKAEKESIQFPNQIPVTELQKGDTVAFKALTLLGQTPQISLSMKDPKTGLAFTKNAR